MKTTVTMTTTRSLARSNAHVTRILSAAEATVQDITTEFDGRVVNAAIVVDTDMREDELRATLRQLFDTDVIDIHQEVTRVSTSTRKPRRRRAVDPAPAADSGGVEPEA